MRDHGQITRHMLYTNTPDSPASKTADEELVRVWRCHFCGWWAAQGPYSNTGGHIMMEVGYGALRPLDPTDISAPINALRAHLMLRPDETLMLHPQRLEDVSGASSAISATAPE